MTSRFFISTAGALLALATAGASRADGAVYTLSNDGAANEVLVFQRGEGGDHRRPLEFRPSQHLSADDRRSEGGGT